MIRINLLGQTRPKTAGPGLPVETTIRWLLLLASVAIAVIVLAVVYFKEERQLDEVNQQISNLQAEKSRLQQVKAEVDQFEHQKAVLQQRINVIETLQKNRTGGQDLLSMVATTVVRTDTLWLTEVNRKGNALDLAGEAGSINAVANFLTQMRRSGYFDKIEIKEAKENDIQKGVQTYSFTMSAEVAAAPGATDGTGAHAAAPGPPTSTPTGVPAKGRS
jgi:Tfp pilus assembly protein PilN